MVATSLLYFRACFLVTGDPTDSYHRLNIRDQAAETWLLPLTNTRLTLYTLWCSWVFVALDSLGWGWEGWQPALPSVPLLALPWAHRTHRFGSLQNSSEQYLPFPKLLRCSALFLDSFFLFWQHWGDSETTRQEIKCRLFPFHRDLRHSRIWGEQIKYIPFYTHKLKAEGRRKKCFPFLWTHISPKVPSYPHHPSASFCSWEGRGQEIGHIDSEGMLLPLPKPGGGLSSIAVRRRFVWFYCMKYTDT